MNISPVHNMSLFSSPGMICAAAKNGGSGPKQPISIRINYKKNYEACLQDARSHALQGEVQKVQWGISEAKSLAKKGRFKVEKERINRLKHQAYEIAYKKTLNKLKKSQEISFEMFYGGLLQSGYTAKDLLRGTEGEIRSARKWARHAGIEFDQDLFEKCLKSLYVKACEWELQKASEDAAKYWSTTPNDRIKAARKFARKAEMRIDEKRIDDIWEKYFMTRYNKALGDAKEAASRGSVKGRHVRSIRKYAKKANVEIDEDHIRQIYKSAFQAMLSEAKDAAHHGHAGWAKDKIAKAKKMANKAGINIDIEFKES